MKKLHDYTAIDTAILTVLSFGPKRLSGMFSGPVWQEACKLESADYKARGIAYTSAKYFISNRLNALRKLEKVVFSSKAGWSYIPEPDSTNLAVCIEQLRSSLTIMASTEPEAQKARAAAEIMSCGSTKALAQVLVETAAYTMALSAEYLKLQATKDKYNWLMNHACWGYPSAEGSNGEEIYLVITGTKADDFEHAERILAQAMKELP